MSKQNQNQSKSKKPEKTHESSARETTGSDFEIIESFGRLDPALLRDERIPAANRQTIAQELGRIHGNQQLQRFLDNSYPAKSSAAPGIQRGFGDIAEGAINEIFRQVVATNVGTSAAIAIPDEWPDFVRDYAAANPDDASVLTQALARSPSYRRGGWIMDIQTDAAAMTLDTKIFVSGPLSLKTYAHELVHVTQYGAMTPAAFLVSYFGLSAITIARRLINREPLNMMRSSPHEEQAYQLARRFQNWHFAQTGDDPIKIKV